MRFSNKERITNETNICINLKIDGEGKANIQTSIPFLDHLLTAFTFYSGFDLEIIARGDIEIDDHHTVEDIGILLGTVIKEALGSKIGIKRFSSVLTPMDEALTRIVLDISNRPRLVYRVDYIRNQIGSLSLENVYEFLYALVTESRITLHIETLYGDNDHHKFESIFKGLGMVFKEAVKIVSNDITSTKGVL